MDKEQFFYRIDKLAESAHPDAIKAADDLRIFGERLFSDRESAQKKNETTLASRVAKLRLELGKCYRHLSEKNDRLDMMSALLSLSKVIVPTDAAAWDTPKVRAKLRDTNPKIALNPVVIDNLQKLLDAARHEVMRRIESNAKRAWASTEPEDLVRYYNESRYLT